MIIGLGIDLCDESRILKTYRRFSGRFCARICSSHEQVLISALSENRLIRRLAMLFAAKEAMAKALGTGFREGVAWRDIEVINDKRGKPGYKLYGGSLARLQDISPKATVPTCLLSLTRETETVAAVAIIEATPYQI